MKKILLIFSVIISLYLCVFWVKQNQKVNSSISEKNDLEEYVPSSTEELALVEIESWGRSGRETGTDYHIGILHARSIETKGDNLPEKFDLSFRYARSSKIINTPWNNIPRRNSDDLRIRSGEWIVGKFVKTGDVWEVVSGEDLFDLSRPEDMDTERLKKVQEYFSTPLVRVWIPEKDVLKDTLDKTKWRMTVGEFKQAFKNISFVEKEWSLSRSSASFRKKIVVEYPNTEIVFEFSGVVDVNSTPHVPLSSSLISFEIKHPVEPHPEMSFTRPPQSMHYLYVKNMHDTYVSRLDKKGIKYENEEWTVFSEYIASERVASEEEGIITFTYWSNITQEGVTARAPEKLIAEDLKKERIAAFKATEDWPISICGNDIMLRENK